ncbi:MAG: hypothetical protein KDM63_17975 [Verrucomicrobiae bacterium]|nr:hypothetical protein [Verrucomicrobiae bacterium]
MKLAPFWIALCLVLTVGQPVNAASGKAGRPSPSRSIIGPQGQLAESHYRPRVRFTAGKMSGQRLPIVATFSTMRGFIDRIEIRVDGKVVDTLRPKQALSSGQMEAAIDLSKIGAGSHKITLWAWQGREGYQRLHGESKSLKLDR